MRKIRSQNTDGQSGKKRGRACVNLGHLLCCHLFDAGPPSPSSYDELLAIFYNLICCCLASLSNPPPRDPGGKHVRHENMRTWEHENVAATSGQDDQWTSWANQTGHSLKLHSQIKHWFQSRSAGKTSQNRSFYLNTNHSKATTRL